MLDERVREVMDVPCAAEERAVGRGGWRAGAPHT